MKCQRFIPQVKFQKGYAFVNYWQQMTLPFGYFIHVDVFKNSLDISLLCRPRHITYAETDYSIKQVFIGRACALMRAYGLAVCILACHVLVTVCMCVCVFLFVSLWLSCHRMMVSSYSDLFLSNQQLLWLPEFHVWAWFRWLSYTI